MRPSVLPFTLVFALLCSACAATPPAPLLPADLVGWEFIATPAADIKSVVTPGPEGVFAVAAKNVGYLQTTTSHENYRLRAEWRWTAKPGNAGILVHIASGPIDRNIWPLCFQIQSKPPRSGDLLPMAGAKFAEPLTAESKVPALYHSAADSEKPAGEWNVVEIVCRGDSIEVTVNGVFQNKVTRCAPAAGKIGFQFEGAPYELRAVSLSPL